jgi:DNA-binding PucR family transcriptional regulator
MLMDWGFAKLDKSVDTDLAFSSYHALAGVTYRYVDLISEQVVVEYQRERELWIAHRSNVVAEILDELLTGGPLNIEKAEAGLRHGLRQPHLGVLLWTDPASAVADLALLETVVGKLNRAMGGRAAPLFWPKDRVTGWAWLAVDADTELPDAALLEGCLAESDPRVRVALGTRASGPDGFRATHLEARRAQQVALVAGDRGPRVTSYGDSGVRFSSLLVNDVEVARRFVSNALGGLACDTVSAARLRETTLVFLEEKGSQTRTSERLYLHKNTVKYRLKRAAEERGRPLDVDRLDLELALIACQWLGSTVLNTPGS